MSRNGRVTVRAVRRKEIDADRIIQALLLLAQDLDDATAPRRRVQRERES